MTVDTPAHLPASIEVSIVDAPSEAFLATGSYAVLHAIEYRDLTWDLFEEDPSQLPADAVVRYRGDRVRISFSIAELPSDRPLWAILTTLEQRSPRACVPGEVLLARFGPLVEGGEHSHVELRVEPAARITGTIRGRPTVEWAGTEDHENWTEEQWADWEQWELEQEPRNRAEFDLDVKAIDARLAGASLDDTTGTGIYAPDRFVIEPVPSGGQRVDLLAHTADRASVHRREFAVTAVRGRLTNLDPWELERGRDPLVLRAVADSGEPLGGTFVLEFDCYAPVVLEVSSGELAHFYGDAADCRLIRFEPATLNTHEPSEQLLPGGLVEDLLLVCHVREAELTSVYLDGRLPDGSRLAAISCAWVKYPSEGRWRSAQLGALQTLCVRYGSTPLPPGELEALIWNRVEGVCYRGSLVIPTASPEEQSVRIDFEDPRTCVRGELRFRVEDELVSGSLTLLVRPSQPASEPQSRQARQTQHPGSQRLDEGPFELRGLPPQVPLELVFIDDADRERAVVGVQLARGETFDLGRIELRL